MSELSSGRRRRGVPVSASWAFDFQLVTTTIATNASLPVLPYLTGFLVVGNVCADVFLAPGCPGRHNGESGHPLLSHDGDLCY